MASMASQSFGVPAEAIELMLTIQNMKYFLKFFLRTGYGDYEDYAGGILDDSEDPVKTQGMCQGNGAALAVCTVTSISMIAAHKRKGHGVYFLAPISDISGQLVGGLL
jgi:hypothetical protein